MALSVFNNEPTYTTAQISVLYRINLRQLQWWDETGLLSPAHTPKKAKGLKRHERIRIYSQEQAIMAGILIELKNKQWSLQIIRRIFIRLRPKLVAAIQRSQSDKSIFCYLIVYGPAHRPTFCITESIQETIDRCCAVPTVVSVIDVRGLIEKEAAVGLH